MTLHFILIFAIAVTLAVSLRRMDEPYADRRLRLDEL
jgi:hypothetical protein